MVGEEDKDVTPTSTELMLALTQIQQLISLLDFKPGGLSHLVPNLLLPLMPIASTSSADPLAVSMGLSGLTQAAQQDAVKRYRAHVQHAFRVSSELVLRLQDAASPARGAVDLAQRLIQQQQNSGTSAEKDRVLRVRKKRRVLLEQEKALQLAAWPQSLPHHLPAPNSESTAELKTESQPLPPTTLENISSYLAYLHQHLPGHVPTTTLELVKSTRIRLVTLQSVSEGRYTFTLEMHVRPVLKAVLDASWQTASDKVELAALRVVSYSEDIMPRTTTQSAYPVFRKLSTDILDAAATVKDEPGPWQMYAHLTQTIIRVIIAAAQFQ